MLLKGERRILLGPRRTQKEPMRVVSASLSYPKVFFEAPPSAQVPAEIAAFINWFNESRKDIRQGAVRAGLSHLYFESIHPFEDGNGRIGRAISEKALSQGLGRPALLSLSRTIEADKRAYYDALMDAQKSHEVTPWLIYFVRTVLEAQSAAQEQIEFVLSKTRFFDRHKDSLKERQLKVILRMLDEGPEGFAGGINATKCMNLTKVSKATATRDLQDLVDKGALSSLGGGRSTRYEVNL